jgi:hypothetical protein
MANQDNALFFRGWTSIFDRARDVVSYIAIVGKRPSLAWLPTVLYGMSYSTRLI